MPKNAVFTGHTKKHQARLERERRQRRYIITGATVVLVLVVGLIVYGLLDTFVFASMQPVVQVGNKVATLRDYQVETKFQRYQLIQQYDQYYQFYQQFPNDPFGLGTQLQDLASQLSDPTTFGKKVIDRITANLVIEREAAKRGITVSDAELNEYMQTKFGYFPKGTPTSTVTPTTVMTSTFSPAQLKVITLTPTPTPGPSPTSTNTPTSIPSATPGAGTPTAVPPTATLVPTNTVQPTATPAGPTATATVTQTPTITTTPTVYTEDLYKNEVKTSLEAFAKLGFTENDLRNLLRNEMLANKLMEDIGKDVAKTQDKIWARHILVADEATATAVRARLALDEDFGKVAAEVSTDTGTKDQGGDLGWFGKGQMVPAFEDAAFKLNIGEIGQPVKSDFGYHIIQLLGKETQALTDEELATAKNTKFQEWLTPAIAADDVKRFDTWTKYLVTDPPFTSPLVPSTTGLDPLATIPTTSP